MGERGRIGAPVQMVAKKAVQMDSSLAAGSAASSVVSMDVTKAARWVVSTVVW